LKRCQAPQGTLIVNNATLWQITEWKEETGVRWFLGSLPARWKTELYSETLPGVAIITYINSSRSWRFVPQLGSVRSFASRQIRSVGKRCAEIRALFSRLTAH
jgi:hypothetical protein